MRVNKIFFVCSFLIPMISFGYPLNPTFKTQQKEYGAILIEWKTTDNPALVCGKGYRAVTANIIGCAIREGIRCTIYTKRELNLAILGHEIRHCYEGNWHGNNEYID